MSVKYDHAKYGSDLSACVHCGLCLQSCPTYLETSSEADSPRGRIVMMKMLHEGDLDQRLPDLRRHLDKCLGCRACETACPSAVKYSELLDVARERMNEARPFLQSSVRRALLNALTQPDKLRTLLKASAATGGMPAAAGRLLMGDPGGTPNAVSLPPPSDTAPLPSVLRPVGERRARVGMLTGCVMRVLYGDVNSDTAAILVANGCEVLVNQHQQCCGALHGHNGFRDESRRLAKSLIDTFSPFDGLDAIVINSAGCGSSMKEYGTLLADDPIYAEKAAAFASLCKDVSEFLDELGWIAPLKSLPIKSTYHDACHLAHAQKITQAPRNLLSLIPELQLLPMPEADVCCGSAGIYNLTEPNLAKRLQERKVHNIVSSGANVVVTSNPGCLAWIAAGLADRDIPVFHPVSVLRASLAVDPLFSAEP
jgi:glycolate oxidase iron-sulfur subunit